MPLLRPSLGAFGTRVTVHFVLHTFYYLPAPMALIRMNSRPYVMKTYFGNVVLDDT